MYTFLVFSMKTYSTFTLYNQSDIKKTLLAGNTTLSHLKND